MIAIVDYGMGNLRSVQKALERVGADAAIATQPETIANADKLVLPGVGGFSQAMENLRQAGLVEPIREFLQSSRPYLGICLGYQLLFESSSEDGRHAGLGVLGGDVTRFDFASAPGPADLKIPHMGWNQVLWDRPCPLLASLKSGTHFYFVHSYYVRPADDRLVCGRCDYGLEFAAMIWKDNIFATQFHPEKSQQQGLRMLANFAEL